MASSSEINANAILAIVYFASGATICGLNLVCISTIPECFGQPFRNVIPSLYLALLAALLLMSTIAVLPSTFVVPLIIGW
ncbi:unnamed protein product [Anisakis simplex]|uniref:Aa_trans domain-containing protein n=1 Tax=Anisakis simplex TaxID=6269 RepID=A0A0M3K5U0_ANISI|nr:unnamed protein product [Anisakis simplex]